ncbi:MAG: hypothetical protein KAI17_08825 [Thiotrichaceae bacterium]|nr:hypothetical protein [Thiotrichaceae bacterium]
MRKNNKVMDTVKLIEKIKYLSSTSVVAGLKKCVSGLEKNSIFWSFDQNKS